MVTLQSPAPSRPVTSPFGWRINPITGKRRHHNGIDYGGTFPVRAAAAGTVISNGFSPSKVNGFGYYVVIQHEGGLRTLYAHGRERSKLKVGAQAKAGDTIFTSGSTGASTGPHLHFEVHRRTLGAYRAVNPAPYLDKPKPKQSGDIDMRMIMNNDDKNENTRRALVGELTFQVITRAEGIRESDLWGHSVKMSKAQWEATRKLVESRRAAVGLPPQGSGGGTDLRPVLDAIAKVPTATQNGQAAREAIVK